MAGNSSDERTRRVLVTGASGFIGRELVSLLLQHGYAVKVLARNPAALEAFPWFASVKPCIGDITREEGLAESCLEAGTIIHCAGFAHSGKGGQKRHAQVNREGTARLLKAAIEAGSGRFIYISSSKAESASPGPYGQAKREAEELLLDAHRKGLIEACCLRPAAVYGRGMKGNLAGWIRLLRKGLAPPLPPVETRLAMIGLRDLCRAVVAALESDAVWGKCYLLGDGQAYRVKELESRMRSALERKPAGWHLPRAVFAWAAAAGELAGYLPGAHIPFGRSGYNTLFFDDYREDPRFRADTGFSPRQDFYAELPDILQEQ